MDRGTYAAASAGIAQLQKLDVVNNNLANVNTAGFKRQLMVGRTQSFDDTLAKEVAAGDPFAKGDQARTPGVIDIETATDFSLGPIRETGNPLDVALENPNDFFVIATPDGLQYSRAGNFTLSSSGQIVTQDGYAVQGDGGEINVTGAGTSVSSNGTVTSGGQQIGRLQVARFEDPSKLERVGATRFALGQAAQPTQVEAAIIPQSLEMSNVSAISSVIDLITTNRAFDLYTKSAKTIDELNSTAIQQVGRKR